jgi:hypothetical protein
VPAAPGCLLPRDDAHALFRTATRLLEGSRVGGIDRIEAKDG